MVRELTRRIDEEQIRLFSENTPFSEHMSKWADPLFPDKYDQNFFSYTGQPTREEFRQALSFQRSRGDNFIKLEGYSPLTDDFGLEKCVTLTMVLQGNASAWKRNPDLCFRAPTPDELEALEVKHFAALYGESFTRRNIRRMAEKLRYHGAYLDDILVGSCYSFDAEGMVCVDGLIVDEGRRRQYIATSLLAHIAELFGDKVLFLHADADDTPKDMYARMGFTVADRLYEYSCTDLANYRLP